MRCRDGSSPVANDFIKKNTRTSNEADSAKYENHFAHQNPFWRTRMKIPTPYHHSFIYFFRVKIYVYHIWNPFELTRQNREKKNTQSMPGWHLGFARFAHSIWFPFKDRSTFFLLRFYIWCIKYNVCIVQRSKWNHKANKQSSTKSHTAREWREREKNDDTFYKYRYSTGTQTHRYIIPSKMEVHRKTGLTFLLVLSVCVFCCDVICTAYTLRSDF